ncbi:MAG TPA: PspC domain-containing protein [bacterium]
MKRLYRSIQDRKIAGVCGGLGEYLGADPTVLRLVAVFLGLVTGIVPGIITYFIAWIIIPEETGKVKK